MRLAAQDCRGKFIIGGPQGDAGLTGRKILGQFVGFISVFCISRSVLNYSLGRVFCLALFCTFCMPVPRQVLTCALTHFQVWGSRLKLVLSSCGEIS